MRNRPCLGASLFALMALLCTSEHMYYKDSRGTIFGPFSNSTMKAWWAAGYFSDDVPAATNISNGFFPMKTYFNELEKLPTVTNRNERKYDSTAFSGSVPSLTSKIQSTLNKANFRMPKIALGFRNSPSCRTLQRVGHPVTGEPIPKLTLYNQSDRCNNTDSLPYVNTSESSRPQTLSTQIPRSISSNSFCPPEKRSVLAYPKPQIPIAVGDVQSPVPSRLNEAAKHVGKLVRNARILEACAILVLSAIRTVQALARPILVLLLVEFTERSAGLGASFQPLYVPTESNARKKFTASLFSLFPLFKSALLRNKQWLEFYDGVSRVMGAFSSLRREWLDMIKLSVSSILKLHKHASFPLILALSMLWLECLFDTLVVPYLQEKIHVISTRMHIVEQEKRFLSESFPGQELQLMRSRSESATENLFVVGRIILRFLSSAVYLGIAWRMRHERTSPLYLAAATLGSLVVDIFLLDREKRSSFRGININAVDDTWHDICDIDSALARGLSVDSRDGSLKSSAIHRRKGLWCRLRSILPYSVLSRQDSFTVLRMLATTTVLMLVFSFRIASFVPLSVGCIDSIDTVSKPTVLSSVKNIFGGFDSEVRLRPSSVVQVGVVSNVVLHAFPLFLWLQHVQDRYRLSTMKYHVYDAVPQLMYGEKGRDCVDDSIGHVSDGPDPLGGIILDGVTAVGGGRVRLRNVSMAVPAGKVSAILGNAYSGKNSVLDLLVDASNLTLQRGAVRIRGRPLPDWNAKHLRDRISHLRIAEPTLPVKAGALAGFRVPQSHDDSENQKRACVVSGAQWVMAALPLGPNEIIDKRAIERYMLTTESLRKLALCRLLINFDKDIVYMEEPSRDMTETEELRLIQYIRSITRQDQTVIVSTSHLSTALKCDYVAIMDRSTVVRQGAPDLFTGRSSLGVRSS